MALPDGMSSCEMCVEIMTGTTWVDISDNVGIVEMPAWTRMSAETYVFGEDTAVLGMGKLQPVEIPIRGVFVNGTADPFYTIWSEFTTPCGDMVALRVSPGGCTTDDDSFRTSTTASEVLSMTPPGGDAGSADVLLWEAIIRSPDLTRAAWS